MVCVDPVIPGFSHLYCAIGEAKKVLSGKPTPQYHRTPNPPEYWWSSESNRPHAAVRLGLGLLVFTMLLVMITNVGRHADDKLKMQNAADAAAVAGGVMLTRGLNGLAHTNHLLCEVGYCCWARRTYPTNWHPFLELPPLPLCSPQKRKRS